MATFQLILRTDKPKKDNTYPIIFKVYLGKKNKIITLPYSCKLNEWDETNKKLRKNHNKYKEINETLKKLDTRLQNAIDDLETQEINYDLNDIKEAFINEAKENRVKIISVNKFILSRIEELNTVGRFGYVKGIKDTHKSLFKFAKQDLKFKQITPEFLDKYEIFLRKTYKDGGIAFRMRDIRTIYNLAIKYGYASQNDYPFKKYKISKLKSKSHKIAITEEELQKFKSFDIDLNTENKKCETTYRMFLFSYYAGGMNFKDMMGLSWSNVENGRLVYKRDKTKGDFNLKLPLEALEILKYFKNQLKPKNTKYVFPIILSNSLTTKQIYGRYKRCIRNFNKELKYIALQVGINKNLTSYVARHSFATHLKFNGVSEDIISQLMGHSDVSVTKAYLEDFGSTVLDEAMSKLN
uniref:tyrosine-type recombinase/integrase n=1 Tax=Mariniflexile sp. TaxID=1979402 RepID=UPI0040485EC2